MMRKSEPAGRWGLEDGSAARHCGLQYGMSRLRSAGRVWETSRPDITQWERFEAVGVDTRIDYENTYWKGVTV